MILTPFQKLPNNAGDLGKIIVATCFEWLPKVQKIAKSGHTGFNRDRTDQAKGQKICCSMVEEEAVVVAF